ncbi:MAG: hypothetical protein WCD86_16495 [Ktedonobacteraceae bacterium]
MYQADAGQQFSENPSSIALRSQFSTVTELLNAGIVCSELFRRVTHPNTHYPTT